MPTVTIGFPVYNGELFLTNALESLLKQTFSDFELIISDNASDDKTEELCRFYAGNEARISYIRQSKNLGAVANFEFVLKQSRSPYFMWAAADDLWAPTYIERCFDLLGQNKTVAAVWSRYTVCSRSLPFLRMNDFPDFKLLEHFDPRTRVSYFLSLDEGTHKANAIYGLWRTPVICEAFGSMLDYANYRDFDIQLITQVIARHRILQIQEPLFFKTYKSFPPGHWLTFWAGKISNILRGRLISPEVSAMVTSLNRILKRTRQTLQDADFNQADVDSICNSLCLRMILIAERRYGTTYRKKVTHELLKKGIHINTLRIIE